MKTTCNGRHSRPLPKRVMILFVLAMTVFRTLSASGGTASLIRDDFEYAVNSAGHAVIIRYLGRSADLIIPETLDGYAVEEVQSLGYNVTVERVTIPDSVSVSGTALGSCAVLKEIRISEDHPGLKLTDHVLFSGDGKTLIAYPSEMPGEEYTVPAGTEAIGEDAFCDCPFLRRVVLPDGLRSIGPGAFALCGKLNEISIPASVDTIGRMAFGNSGLMKLDLSRNTGLTEIADLFAYGCCQLSELVLPESVVSIGDEAFLAAELSSVVLPAGVERIGVNPFRDCFRLREIAFSGPNQRYAAEYPFLVDVWESKAVSCVAYGPESLTFPDSVSFIGDYCCSGLSEIRELVIPAGIRRIGARAFTGCHELRTVLIKETEALEIMKEAFEGCTGLSAVTVLGSVARIEENAFAGIRHLRYVHTNCETVREYFSELGVPVIPADEPVPAIVYLTLPGQGD